MDAMRISTDDTLYKMSDILLTEATIVPVVPNLPLEKKYTAAEVAAHDSSESLYMTIHGKVYDLTDFQNAHPGGAKILQKHAGKDATKQFQKYHRDGILLSHEDKIVGVLEEKAERKRSVFGWIRGKS